MRENDTGSLYFFARKLVRRELDSDFTQTVLAEKLE